MKALILAGGSGTRLWPLSRKNYPKQFLTINGDKSLLCETIQRCSPLVSPENIIVITNSEYKFHVRAQLDSLSDIKHAVHLVFEPAGRNTAPAILLGVKYCMEKLGCKESEVLFISPSDQLISPVDGFHQFIRKAEKAAKEGHIVTFGIRPAHPETAYGYMKTSSQGPLPGRPDSLKVEQFFEKPDVETAKRYLKEGCYLWNSGMFAFTIGTIIEEFQKYAPEMSKMLALTFDELTARFSEMPAISLDYAVMEKSDNIVAFPLDLRWNDVGSWDSFFEMFEKDENGNMKKGNVLAIDTTNTLIIGNKRLITSIGMEDCLIVETDDAVLITKRGHSQKVREVIRRLEKDNRREAAEHTTAFRPWGSYTILEEGNRYKIKRIMVSPGERLSLQMHLHRSEHWVVVTGTAKATIGAREILIHENESAYVPKSTLHKLENPGRVPLEIIEVQNGEYVQEDDIVRIDDAYGRQG